LSLLRTTDDIEKKLGEVALPMLVIHGGSDVVTDPSISKLLYEKAKSSDKVLRLYEEAWHCILEGEPDDMVKKVMTDIITWLDARSTSKGFMEQGKDSRQGDLEQTVALAKMTPGLVNPGNN
jgi:alpha-beta hydrolase superfamily lysophospholipase